MKLSKKFSPHLKPSWYDVPPKKQITTTRVKYKSPQLHDGDIVYNEKGEPLILSIEYDHYDDEQPDQIYLYQYEETVEDNPKYDKELEQYKARKEKYQKELKLWKEQKKLYDKQLADKKEEDERVLFEQLKKKYESEKN